MKAADHDPRPGRRLFRLPTSDRRIRTEVDEELRFHLEERVDELVARGVPRDQAEREVREKFGDLAQVERECESIDRSTYRRTSAAEWVSGMLRDFRYAVRGLLRTPTFTVVAIATLALGIGANTAIFSAVHAVLVRPLPVPWLDRLVTFRNDLHALNLLDIEIAIPEAIDIEERTDLFDAATAFAVGSRNLTGLGEPRRVTVVATLGNYPAVFGAQPVLGRWFHREEFEQGQHRVTAISHALWQREFGGANDVVGRTVEMNGLHFAVVGVMPAGARYPRSAELWVPLALNEENRQQRGRQFLTAVARLRPGVTIEQARSQVGTMMANAAAATGAATTSASMRTEPFLAFAAGELRPILLVLLGAVVFVLLITCANVASLQLVRTTARARELAVRVALGAGRRAIGRQMITESMVLALAGGMAGVLTGFLAIRLLRGVEMERFPALQDLQIHAPVLVFAAVVAIVAGLIFGTVPALRAMRVGVQETLKDATRGTTLGGGRHRFLQATVVAQVALALVLLLGAGLTIRSLSRLMETSPGFQAERVVSMSYALPGSRYPTPVAASFQQELMERLRGVQAVEAVEAVGSVFGLPFSDQANSSPFSIEGRATDQGGEQPHSRMYFAGGDYFRAMGIRVIAGRVFDRTDVETAPPVVVIDETLARQFFPGEDPIGKRISQGPEGTIIGVVADVKQSDLADGPKATTYWSFSQNPWATGNSTIVVRAAGDPQVLGSQLAGVVRSLDPQLPVFDIRTLDSRVAESLGPRRLAMQLLGSFAMLALVLAAMGIYGVLSYGTSTRTQEIGIRVALGAQQRDVIGMVLRGGLLLVGLGLAAGLVIFLGARRLLEALLYGVSTTDAATLTIAVALLLVAGFLACWIPARRAASVDPTVTMRSS